MHAHKFSVAEAEAMVKRWRERHPAIVNAWNDLADLDRYLNTQLEISPMDIATFTADAIITFRIEMERVNRILHNPSIPDAEARGRAMSACAMAHAKLLEKIGPVVVNLDPYAQAAKTLYGAKDQAQEWAVGVSPALGVPFTTPPPVNVTLFDTDQAKERTVVMHPALGAMYGVKT